MGVWSVLVCKMSGDPLDLPPLQAGVQARGSPPTPPNHGLVLNPPNRGHTPSAFMTHSPSPSVGSDPSLGVRLTDPYRVGGGGAPKVATRRNMRREERVTVQGPVKEQQPDGMSHRGGADPFVPLLVSATGTTGTGSVANISLQHGHGAHTFQGVQDSPLHNSHGV